MDIVGSILKKMTAPPVMDEKERKIRQSKVTFKCPHWRYVYELLTWVMAFILEQLELQKKQREAEQKRIQDFRDQVMKRITAFDTDEEKQGPRLTFDPMDKLRRSIM